MARLDMGRWKEISALLDELLDVDASARAARLGTIRADDAALARELEALLAHESKVVDEGWLEGSVLVSGEGLEGLTLGGYTLDACIGHGGMGSVWLAHRSDGRFEGNAAVKLLNLALMGREGAKRFQREGSLLARLQHPHIARLLDAGLAPGGQPYLVLEHIEGGPIDRVCDARRADVESRLRLFLEVVDAVAYAHSRLVVHLDLKPSNILVTAEGEPKLLDFGIARLIDESGATGDDARVTLTAARAFTPDYAAPEQLRGEPVSGATDVYALGVLLYVLLSGQHPTAPRDGTLAQHLQAALGVEPVRLSVAVVRGGAEGGRDAGRLAQLAEARGTTPAALARSLAGDLDNIVAKALSKDPQERYPTPAALGDDLRRHFEHHPVVARAASLRYRAGKFIVRHRWTLGLSAAVVLSLSAVTSVAVWKSIESGQRRVQAEFDAKRSTASLDLLYLVLSDTAAMSARTMSERLARIRQVVRESSEEAGVKLALLERLAGRYMELGEIDEMLAVLGEMRVLATQVNDEAELAVTACGFANAYTVLGRYDDAEREIAVAKPFVERGRARDLGARSECWQAEAELALLRGQPQRSLAVARRSVEAYERTGGTRDPIYMAALNQVALAQAALSQYGESYRMARKARDALRVVNLQGTQQDLIIAMQEMEMLLLGGRPLDALKLLTELRADPHVAAEHQVPQFAIDQRIGLVSMKLDRAAEALAAYGKAIDGAHAAGNRLFEQSARIGAVEALTAEQRLDEARAQLAALPGGADAVATGSSLGAKVLILQARIELAAGAPAQAASTAARAGQFLAAVPWADRRLRDALATEASAAIALGDWPRALERAHGVLERARAEAIDPASSSEVGEALLIGARAEAAQGHRDAARALAAEALPHLRDNLGEFHPLAVEAATLSAAPR